MGIRHFVFAVNKMDLVGYSEERFKEIEKDIRELAKSLDLYDVVIIPVSATEGDNVTKRSENMPWYTGRGIIKPSGKCRCIRNGRRFRILYAGTACVPSES